MADSAAIWLYDSSERLSASERRVHTRHDLGIEIQLVHGGRTLAAMMENISLGGACLAVQYGNHLQVGEEVTCVFTPSASLRISLTATIRWIETGGSALAGLQFHTMLRPDQLLAFLGHDPDDGEG